MTKQELINSLVSTSQEGIEQEIKDLNLDETEVMNLFEEITETQITDPDCFFENSAIEEMSNVLAN